MTENKINRREYSKVAIPKPKGELSDFLRFLNAMGCETKTVNKSNLVFEFPALALPILLVAMRPRDVGQVVADPNSEFCFGFTGSDIVAEQNLTVMAELPVEVQRQPSNLVIGSTPNLREKVATPTVQSLSEFDDARVVTAYPNFTRQWLRQQNITAGVVELQGATEAYWWGDPNCMAVLDVVQSGQTFVEEEIEPMEKALGPVKIQVVRTPDTTRLTPAKMRQFLLGFGAVDELLTKVKSSWRTSQSSD